MPSALLRPLAFAVLDTVDKLHHAHDPTHIYLFRISNVELFEAIKASFVEALSGMD